MSKKILIVDDEEDIRKLTTLRLRKAGYEVVSVSSGDKALPAVIGFSPDLVLLDLRLPKQDGLDICRQIKRHPEFGHIPVILFTAVVPQGLEDSLRESRADGFILKPFRSDDLLDKIRCCLEKKQTV